MWLESRRTRGSQSQHGVSRLSAPLNGGFVTILVIHRPRRARTFIHRFANTPVDSGSRPQILVMKSELLIEHLLTEDPILLARDHRDLRNPIVRATKAGRLTRLLPGVYVDTGRAHDLATRVAALRRWDPDAVVCGRAAAGTPIVVGCCWLVLRFTWYLLNHEPGYVVTTTKRALEARRTNPEFNGPRRRDTPLLAS